ncbi:MAG: hypothetical protein LBE78_12995 [Burkholderiaceae bacterium]|jgi:hypothetical protein|nr:hypothetical protein [Burkholderiaceae bacterium]
MNAAGWLLGMVVAALVSAAGGYAVGQADGLAKQQARQDAQAVADLSGIIGSHTALIEQANAASTAMRQTMSLREAADRKTSQEIRHALASTAASRVGCSFPADVMRQLQAARERAAEAAAGGIRRALPHPAASAGKRG